MLPTDDPVDRFFAELDDPSKFHRVEGVAVLKPFDVVLKDGKPHKVEAGDLHAWASETNALESSGVLPIITAGHRLSPRKVMKTAPDGTTFEDTVPIAEVDQPDVLGYERNFRVGTLKGQPALVCDQYFRIGRVDIAREFPFRSVEFYPGRAEIRATALLKRDPQLDLGLIAFAQGEGAMADDTKDGDDTTTTNTDPAPAQPEALTPEEEAMWAKFEKFKPYLAFARQCFEAQTPMTTQQPVQPPPQPTDDQVRMAHEQQAIKFGQMEQRMAALEADNKRLRENEQRAVCEQMVTQLEAEGFSLDRAREVATLIKMDSAERPAHIAYARQHYSRSAVNQDMIPVAGDTGGPVGQKRSATRQQSDAAVKLSGEKGISFDAALAQVMGA